MTLSICNTKMMLSCWCHSNDGEERGSWWTQPVSFCVNSQVSYVSQGLKRMFVYFSQFDELIYHVEVLCPQFLSVAPEMLPNCTFNKSRCTMSPWLSFSSMWPADIKNFRLRSTRPQVYDAVCSLSLCTTRL